MKLILKEGLKSITIAEISNGKVVIYNPTIERLIKHSLTLPALKKYHDFFGSYTVASDHKKWALAVKIFLDFNIVSLHPDQFQWVE